MLIPVEDREWGGAASQVGLWYIQIIDSLLQPAAQCDSPLMYT
jgi:hypothetical protein